MSHNTNNDPGNKNPTASHKEPTPWEQLVLHAASLKKLLLFDLEIDDNKRFQANKSRKEKKRSMSETDTDTAAMTEERQRANSAPGNTASTNTSTSTSFASSFESITPNSSDHITFGPVELLALSPATFREDTGRQAALIKVRASEGLTMKRRLQAEEGLPESDGEFMMSGGLCEDDDRCEVCEVENKANGWGWLGEAGSPTL